MSDLPPEEGDRVIEQLNDAATRYAMTPHGPAT